MTSGTILPFAGAGSVSGTSDHQVLADFTRIFDGLRAAADHVDACDLDASLRAAILVALARASMAVLEANSLFVGQLIEQPEA